MPRNNKRQNRWMRTREKERAQFAQPKTVCVEKAVLCRFLAGDGSIVTRTLRGSLRHDIKFYPDDEVTLATYMRFFKQVYAKTPTVRQMKNFYSVSICFRAIGDDFLQAAAFGVHRWRAPAFLSTNEKIAWLRALYSAEGHVGKDPVRIQMVNEAGIRTVSDLLASLDVHDTAHSYQPKKNTHSKVHILIIQKKAARERFAELISFWHAKKTAALAKALDLKAFVES